MMDYCSITEEYVRHLTPQLSALRIESWLKVASLLFLLCYLYVSIFREISYDVHLLSLPSINTMPLPRIRARFKWEKKHLRSGTGKSGKATILDLCSVNKYISRRARFIILFILRWKNLFNTWCQEPSSGPSLTCAVLRSTPQYSESSGRFCLHWEVGR